MALSRARGPRRLGVAPPLELALHSRLGGVPLRLRGSQRPLHVRKRALRQRQPPPRALARLRLRAHIGASLAAPSRLAAAPIMPGGREWVRGFNVHERERRPAAAR